MLSRVSISGYKSLLDIHDVTCAELNVFVGENASGKSSFIQALLLVKQIPHFNDGIKTFPLSGDLYEAGVVYDVLHEQANREISFSFIFDEEMMFRCDLSYDRDRSERPDKLRFLDMKTRGEPLLRISPLSYGADISKFAYLNAERLGPRVTYPLSKNFSISGVAGKYGEYTTHCLEGDLGRKIIPGWCPALIKKLVTMFAIDGKNVEEELLFSEGRLDTVSNLVLGWILPGAEFNVQVKEDADIAMLSFARSMSDSKTFARSTHVGFGLSYSLPIIVAALSLSDKDSIFIVENPEAHLHPFSQSRIGLFLGVMAGLGRQIFVETHSDHVVNGIRLGVNRGVVNSEGVVFNFFERDREQSVSNVTQIKVSKNGAVTKWPRGFFDQQEHDLLKFNF